VPIFHVAFSAERCWSSVRYYLARLVTVALRAAHVHGRSAVDGELLRAVADVMTLRRHAITAVDGEPDEGHAHVAVG
jgi:hypothetical protein